MTRIAAPWALALSSLLIASCAEQGVRHPGAATVTHPKHLAVGSLAPGKVSAKSALPSAQQQSPGVAGSNVWERLRNSFEMADCSGDPQITHWARRYTARPQQFEDQMLLALPRLVYVQQIAAKHHVAGEFALLPWVESQYRPAHGRHHKPSGMWQIMPKTAGTLGLHIGKNYDGRMDVSASTDAVMSMLRRYQDRFHDWRVTDYAYNAGQFGVRKLIARHGNPASTPIIPSLPVRHVTREHLIKLMAIACVVRDPSRFQVTLPMIPATEHLVAVPLKRAMPMTAAAKRAGLPVETLRRYNSGSRNGRLDPRHARSLLLPKSSVRTYLAAAPPASIANASTAEADVSKAAKPQQDSAANLSATASPTHTVCSGETLWEIAKHYSIALKQLLRWNDLRSNQLQIGQVLLLQAPQ